MKILTTKNISLSFLILFFLTGASAFAQKQPSIQSASLRAPDNLIVNGVLKEWTGGKLQAYNTANRVSYTICNDDSNLYIVIRALGPNEINKVVTGGVTLTFSNFQEKKLREKNNIQITYPVTKYTVNNMDMGNREYQSLKKDSSTNKKNIDSLARVYNYKLKQIAKTILVKGLVVQSEELNPEQNLLNINAISSFNSKLALTYEFSIPLKYIGVKSINSQKISYNIKLNGYPFDEKTRSGKFAAPISDASSNEPIDPNYAYVNSVTNFWAEYILASK